MKDRHSRPPRQNRNAAMLNGWPVDRQDPVESGRFYPLHAPEAFGDPVLARLPAEVASRTAGLLERLGQSGGRAMELLDYLKSHDAEEMAAASAQA